MCTKTIHAHKREILKIVLRSSCRKTHAIFVSSCNGTQYHVHGQVDNKSVVKDESHDARHSLAHVATNLSTTFWCSLSKAGLQFIKYRRKWVKSADSHWETWSSILEYSSEYRRTAVWSLCSAQLDDTDWSIDRVAFCEDSPVLSIEWDRDTPVAQCDCEIWHNRLCRERTFFLLLRLSPQIRRESRSQRSADVSDNWTQCPDIIFLSFTSSRPSWDDSPCILSSPSSLFISLSLPSLPSPPTPSPVQITLWCREFNFCSFEDAALAGESTTCQLLRQTGRVQVRRSDAHYSFLHPSEAETQFIRIVSNSKRSPDA